MKKRGKTLFGRLFSSRKGQTTMAGVASKEFNKKDTGTIFLILALIIFIIDMTSFLGAPYSGFEWVWSKNTFNIFFNLIQSSIFIAFIVMYGLRLLASRKVGEGVRSEALSYVFFALVMTFFLTNNFWSGNIKAYLHLLFILFFGLTFIRTHDDSSACWFWIGMLLIIDFFLSSLLSKVAIFRYFPFLFLFVSWYVYGKTENRLAIIFVCIIFVSIVTFSWKDQATAYAFGGLGIQTAEGKMTLNQMYIDGVEGGSKWYKSASSGISRALDYASGGYYSQLYQSKPEETQKEPLGVYLDGIKSSQPLFYEDEKIIVWGNVKARTIDEPVKVNVQCYVKTKNNRTTGFITNTFLTEGTLLGEMEEESFDCVFDNTEKRYLPTGTHTVKVKAVFDFTTQSYLKTYYIDEESKRAMVRENIDILDKFKITEKKPISVFTTGPLKLSIGTKEPPTGISSTEDKTWVGLSLENNWEGELESIKELVILVPYGMDIEPNTCTAPFLEFTASDCPTICSDSTSSDSCVNNCNTLLSGTEGEQYKGYKLDVETLKKEIEKNHEEIRDNKRFRSFRCDVKVSDRSALLGNTPLSIKYFKALARYEYSIEKGVSITIKKIPTTTT